MYRERLLQCGPLHQDITSVRQHFSAREMESIEVEMTWQECRPNAARRRVLPQSAAGSTKDLVVLNQQNLPDYLFTDFCLLDANGSTLEELEYHKEGYKLWGAPIEPRIMYDIHEEDEEWTGYARIINKNTYYKDLLVALFYGILFGMTEYSAYTFIAALYSFRGGNTYSTVPVSLKWLFVLSKLLCFVVRVCIAIRSARRVWQADANQSTGSDFVTKSNLVVDGAPMVRHARFMERAHVFLASIVFHLLEIRSLVTELPIRLHPWKSGQSYAAFQADHTRGFLLGYPSQYVFRAEDQAGHLISIALTFIETLLLTILRVKCILAADDQEFILSWESWYIIGRDGIFFVVNVAPGVLTIVLSIRGFLHLIYDRKRAYKTLEHLRNHGNDKQRFLAKRLLRKIFGIDAHVALNQATLSYDLRVVDEVQAKTRCAELLRELRLWRLPDRFGHELANKSLSEDELEKALSTLESVVDV